MICELLKDALLKNFCVQGNFCNYWTSGNFSFITFFSGGGGDSWFAAFKETIMCFTIYFVCFKLFSFYHLEWLLDLARLWHELHLRASSICRNAHLTSAITAIVFSRNLIVIAGIRSMKLGPLNRQSFKDEGGLFPLCMKHQKSV